jgi:hypothetical protein
MSTDHQLLHRYDHRLGSIVEITLFNLTCQSRAELAPIVHEPEVG